MTTQLMAVKETTYLPLKYCSDTSEAYLHDKQVAWQVKYASGKVLGIVLSIPPLNFSFRSC